MNGKFIWLLHFLHIINGQILEVVCIHFLSNITVWKSDVRMIAIENGVCTEPKVHTFVNMSARETNAILPTWMRLGYGDPTA